MINKYDEQQSFFYENGFYLTSQPYRIGNILSHYEIYKKIITLPGNILEVGVFKGGSLIQWATFRELLENKMSRQIIGFDVFGEFPQSETIKSDNFFIEKWNKQFVNEFLSKEDIEKCLTLKKFENIQLIKGDIRETLPDFLQSNPELRIAMLHIDTDVYEPCAITLELCWDRIIPGGILLLDDYGTIEGETVAIEDFFHNHKKSYSIHKFPFSHSKPSYIIKE